MVRLPGSPLFEKLSDMLDCGAHFAATRRYVKGADIIKFVIRLTSAAKDMNGERLVVRACALIIM